MRGSPTRALAAATSALALRASAAGAQIPADTTTRVTFGAYVDAYYAWDTGRPPSFDRSFAGGTPFTTQPARHNEFNVNLAYLEAVLAGPRVRGRLALQAGTSVQANYASEPTTGTVSGPSLGRHLQEAFAGYRVADGLWVDAGVFFSHVGMESWISRDNPHLTRSLVAEYSPYYSSGVRLTWAATPTLTARVDMVNGWQNIAENNSGKGAGVRLDYALTPWAAVSYYNLFSDEAGNRLRTFNGVGAKLTAARATVHGEFDVGTQGKSARDGGTATWYGAMVAARLQVDPHVWLVGRLERYDDADQVIIATGTRTSDSPNGPFRADGGSVGIDVVPLPRVLWRTEARGWRNRDAIFPDGTSSTPKKTGGFVVSSLALTF